MAQPISQEVFMNVPSPFKPYPEPVKLMQPVRRSFDNRPLYSQATTVGSTTLCHNRTDVEGAATVGEVAQSRITGLPGVDEAAVWVGLRIL